MRKKLNIILFFLTITTLALAQEKQNDATLEETINWINDYGLTNMINEDNIYPRNFSLKENNKIINFQWYGFNNGKRQMNNVNANASNIEKLSVQKINLNSHQYKDSYEVEIYIPDAYGSFYFNSKEEAISLYKAFEHLFYLLCWNIKCENTTVNKNRF